jgi:hypothetical protein
VDGVLREQHYEESGRSGKGLVHAYIGKITGLSRTQMTRLIGQYCRGEDVKPKAYRRHRFAKRYTGADIELPAAVDEAHGTLSGPATQKLLQRARHDFGEQRYEGLAQISVAQLYRLRQSRRYREKRVTYQPTKPVRLSGRSSGRCTAARDSHSCVPAHYRTCRPFPPPKAHDLHQNCGRAQFRVAKSAMRYNLKSPLSNLAIFQR